MSRGSLASGVVAALVSTVAAKAQQSCPAVLSGISESADLSVTDYSKVCAVDDGGYVKVNTIYRLHVAATVTGSCQTYYYSGGTCVPLSFYLHTAVNTKQNLNGGVVSGNNGVQSYNTCGNGNCTPVNTLGNGTSWSTNTAGTYVYTATHTADGGTVGSGLQYCNMSYTYLSNNSVTLNALQCAPGFETVPGTNNIPHLQPTVIQIYTALSGSGIEAAIDAAAANWQAALANVTISRTTVDCGTAATCIKVMEGPLPSNCATFATGDLSTVNGEIASGSTITLSTDSSSYGSWTTFGSGLARLIAHELGHLLGLNDQGSPCTNSYSVMYSPQACNSAADASPTINDFLPVNNTVYGGGPRTSCGF